MDNFGVVSAGLKRIAKKPIFPATIVANNLTKDETIDFMGARVKNLTTAGEQSATGMDRIRGVLVLSVAPGSAASAFLQANDMILAFNHKQVSNLKDLQEARNSVSGKTTEIIIFRNQQQVKRTIEIKI
jgi:S1-C subfamily serine protease